MSCRGTGARMVWQIEELATCDLWCVWGFKYYKWTGWNEITALNWLPHSSFFSLLVTKTIGVTTLDDKKVLEAWNNLCISLSFLHGSIAALDLFSRVADTWAPQSCCLELMQTSPSRWCSVARPFQCVWDMLLCFCTFYQEERSSLSASASVNVQQ